jgi:hypothetical protein
LLGALGTWRVWHTETRVQERFRRTGNKGSGGGGGGNTEEKSDHPCQLKKQNIMSVV